MMEAEEYLLAMRRLVENVNLLWALNETPEVPQECELQDGGSTDDRQLTLGRERQLASIFAFIAAYSEDNRTVMAVTVEERAEERGMVVRLATNSGDLASVKEHFENIASILIKAARRGELVVSFIGFQLTTSDTSREELVDAVHSQIIFLDHIRIKSRIRSRHSPEDRKKLRKGSPKPSFIESLAAQVRRLPADAQGMDTGFTLASLNSKCKTLLDTFISLEALEDGEAESSAAMDLLKSMTRQSYELDSEADLGLALKKAPGIKPSLRGYLPVSMKKLGNYYSVAKDLVDAARSPAYTIFDHIAIEVLDCPPSKVNLEDLQSFEAVLNRFSCQLAESNKTDQTRKKYESRKLEKSSGWKVHAEIQLLLHYESAQIHPIPRIICSSKSACYLCHLFFDLHGRFQLSRTHGRIYEKWLLPSWTGLNPAVSALLKDFNARIEEKITEYLRPAWLYESRVCTHPPESIAESFSSFDSTSTIRIEDVSGRTILSQLFSQSLQRLQRLPQLLSRLVAG